MENKELLNEFGDLLEALGVSKVVKIGKHEIRLRTLGYDEQSKILKAIPTDLKEVEKLDVLQKELLSAAIESIDNKKLPKQDIMYLLGIGQAALCNLLYNEYESLLGDQNQLTEEVKTNSSTQVTKID